MLRTLALCLLLTAGLLAKTAELDGRKVHYETYGKGKAVVVLIHGWTCSSALWQEQIPALSKDYKVIAIDLPGHGQSELAPDYSMDRFARAVDAVMRKEKAGTATLMGHSMGGAVIVNFAHRFPDRLDRVVLVDTILLKAEQAGRMTKVAEAYAGAQAMAAREKMVAGMYTPATSTAARDLIGKTMLGTPADVAAGAMKGMFSAEGWPEGVFAKPALAVMATESPMGSEAALKERFPQLTYRRLTGVGHFLQMEKPKEFNALVLEWLKN